ncbi:NEDD4-binding protein 2-like 2 [Thunnus thynnus]|uniref:NEDD4-binding protein 2-like 2 n=1 Tax=Thunnus thynnus TaxID=8237 RepID=UPI0035280499
MMSQACATSPKEKNPDVKNNNSVKDSTDKGAKCVGDTSTSSDRNVRERVLKEVGFTSTTFIGPAFPPGTAAATVKVDIEDTLSEFYKELESIDAPDGTNSSCVTSPKEKKPGVCDSVKNNNSAKDSTDSGAKCVSNNFSSPGADFENINNTSRPAATDGYRRSSGQKQPSWPHWYQNEPYHPRKPRSGIDLNSGIATPAHDQQHYPQALNRPPNPRFDRPPFHRPPPPSAFPNPQNPPSYVNRNWSGSGMTNQYQEQSHFPPFSRFPPTYECSHPSQDFYGDTPHHLDRDERGYNHDAQPDVNVGWSRDAQEEWLQFDEDYDRHRRFDSENELWEQQHHCRPPDNTRAQHFSSVLILMRGLPGSGKSTMARELLSTGPSGLILSTDDYFAHKDGYHYEPGLLGEAHEWNQRRAKDAMHDGRTPVIIDNTNIQAWEMKPYIKLALERGYRVDFCEPDTNWKFDPYELEKRNKHGVPQEKIAQMLDRFSFPISIDIVMSSQEPPHVNQRRRPEQPQMRKSRDFY